MDINKKYVKRSLTLRELDIPIDKYIEKCYKNFVKTFNCKYSDVEILTLDDRKHLNFYKNHDKIIFDYGKGIKYINIDEDFYINYIGSLNEESLKEYNERKFLYQTDKNTLMGILEYYFNLEINDLIIPDISPQQYYTDSAIYPNI